MNLNIIFLAHLSRRLIGELLVYRGICHPSVRRQHFQTTSSLKPLGRFFSYFIYLVQKEAQFFYLHLLELKIFDFKNCFKSVVLPSNKDIDCIVLS